MVLNKLIDSIDRALFENEDGSKNRRGLRESITKFGMSLPLGIGEKVSDIRTRNIEKGLGMDSRETRLYKKTKEYKPLFVETADKIAAERAQSASEREAAMEVIRKKNAESPLYGGGITQKGFGTALGAFPREKIPDLPPIPPAPTAADLSRQLSEKEVLDQLVQIRKDWGIPERKVSALESATKGIIRGATYGIVDLQTDPESLYGKSLLQERPFKKSEKISGTTGEVFGSFAGYSGMANLIGRGLRTAGAINAFAKAHPFLYGATIQNLGEEMVDMSLRKSTGQEYSASTLFFGLALGGAAEGIFSATRANAVRKHLDEVVAASVKDGKYKSSSEIYDIIKNQEVPGPGKKMTYEDLHKDLRKMYYRNKSNGLDGFTKEGRLAGLKGPADGMDDLAKGAGDMDDIPLNQLTPGQEAESLFAQGDTVRLSDLILDPVQLERAKADISAGDLSLSDAPIKVDVTPDGKYRLLDGYHRYTQALNEGKTFLEYEPINKAPKVLSAREQIKETARKVLAKEMTPSEGVEAMKSIEVSRANSRIDTIRTQGGADPGELDELLTSPTLWQGTKDTIRSGLRPFKYVMANMADAGFLRRQGKEGMNIMNAFDAADREKSLRNAALMKDGIPILERLTDVEARNAADAAEGLAEPMNDNVMQFVEWWRKTSKDIGVSAQSSGLKTKSTEGNEYDFALRDNYLPHILNEDAVKEVNRSEARRKKLFQDMIAASDGRLKNETDAQRLWDRIAGQPRTMYGNLERSREFDLPHYMLERDVRKIIPRYVEGSTARIADAKHLGPNQERINEQIDIVRQRGTEESQALADYMVAYANRVSGTEALKREGAFNPMITQASKFLRSAMIVKNMGLSAINQIGDVSKAFGRTGNFSGTMKAILKDQFTKQGRGIAYDSGTLQQTMRNLGEDFNDMELAEKFLTTVQFQRGERSVRTVIPNAYVNDALRLVKSLNKKITKSGGSVDSLKDEVFISRIFNENVSGISYRRLAKYLPDPDAAIKRGYLTAEEKANIAFTAVSETQPILRTSLPPAWQSPSGRIATQFKSFAYKNGNFIKEHIIKEAAQGNVRPLIYFTLFSAAIGEPIASTRAWISGKERTNNTYKRVIENAMSVGGASLTLDLLSEVMYGQQQGLASFIVGPTFDYAGELLNSTLELTKGNTTPIIKTTLDSIPVVGRPIRNRIYPPANRQPMDLPILDPIMSSFGVDTGDGSGSSGSRARPRARRTRPNRQRTR